MRELSILIPARNEEFLTETIEDILKHIESDTEILVGLDGKWSEKPIKDNPRVTVLHYSESIGQRAITNQLCRLSKAKYVMKVDAHCAFDQGFDRKMIEKMEPDITMIPVMRNLHVFNWACKNGHSRYQGPSGPCKQCGEPTKKDIVWIPKTNPQSTAYRFDKDLHFQYWNDFGKRQKGDLTETLSIQGSCFMLTRDKYWELDISSEEFGSWGQQGVEVACKSWLSGGRVLVNRNTWYAHMFRTQGGDFSFPYSNPQSEVKKNRELSKELFMKDNWKGAIHPFSWLIEKFNPPEWGVNSVSKGILYYSDNKLNMRLAGKVRKQIRKSGLNITSVTLKPTRFGKNFAFSGERGPETMFKQILKGLKEMKEDVVYFCEHDVLYHKDHFKFTPTDKETFYYNSNYWMLRLSDGFSIHYNVSPLSGLVVYREAAIKHFEERIAFIKKEGFSYRMGFEPFTHKRIKWNHLYKFETFKPESPNIDIAHDGNVTWKRWDQKDFRKKPEFWEESSDYNVPFWPELKSMLID